MTALEWVKLALAIIAGILACTPLVAKVCNLVQMIIKEKNWKLVINTIPELMEVAEVTFGNGEDRKRWVMEQIDSVAEKVQFEIDAASREAISVMIDAICTASRVINKEEDV